MLTIKLATTNPGKVICMQEELEPYNIRVIPVNMQLTESRSEDPAVIASEKVLEAYRQLSGEKVIAVDAAFHLKMYDGWPDTHVNHPLGKLGVEGFLRLMSDQNDQADRECEFVHTLAYMDQWMTEPKIFIGRIQGFLAHESSPNNDPRAWTQLARIFIPHGFDKVEAELDVEERNRHLENSHSYIHTLGRFVLKQERIRRNGCTSQMLV